MPAPYNVQVEIDRLKASNPRYRNLRDEFLYRKLKRDNPDLVWAEVDTPKSPANIANTSPSYLNSFQEWMDGPINEKSWNWVRDAYNTSLTGMTEQLVTGKKRYKLDAGYTPNVLEDIGTMALSFLMPLDVIAMAAGGGVARGGLALAGFNKRAAGTLGKLGMDYILPQAVQQAGSLAMYEGAVGGVQAALNDEDVMKGIFEGALHGGILGGVAGGVGGGLAYKHAEIIRGFETAGKLTKGTKEATELLSKTDKAKMMGSGMLGQIGAESGVFSAFDISERKLKGEDVGIKDFIASWAKNIGLFGVLKGQKAVWNKVLSKGKTHLDMLEASEREKLGIKEDGTSSEGRALDNVLKPLIESERRAREENRIVDAEDIAKTVKMITAEKTEVDQRHINQLEEFNGIRSVIKKLKSQKDISEDTVSDFVRAIDSLIGVEERLIEGASEGAAKIYRGSLNEFKETQKELLDWADRTFSDPHGKKHEVDIPLEFGKEKILEINKKLGLNLGELDLSKSEDRIAATSMLNKAMDVLAQRRGLERDIPFKSAMADMAETLGLTKKMEYKDVEVAVKREGYADLNKIEKIKKKKPAERTDAEKLFLEKGKDINDILSADITPESKNVLSYAIHNNVRKLSTKDIKQATDIVEFAEKRYAQSIDKLGTDKLQTLFKDYINDRIGVEIIDPKTFALKDKKALRKLFNGNREKAGEAMAEYNDVLNRTKELFHHGAMAEILNFNILMSKQPAYGRLGTQIKLYQLKGRKEITIAGGEEGLRKISQKITGDNKSFKIKDGKKEIEISAEEASLLMEVATDSKGRTTDFHELLVNNFKKKDKQLVLEGKEATYRINLRESTVKALDTYIKKNKLGKYEKIFSHESTAGFNNFMVEVFNRAPKSLKPEIIDTWTGKSYKYDTSLKTDVVEFGKVTRGGESVIKGIQAGSIFRRTFGKQISGVDTHGHLRESTIKHYDKSGEAKNITEVHHQLESASSELGTTTKELQAQVKYFKEKYPELEISLKDNLGKYRGEYILGRIAGYTAEIARGRARADTIPHEVTHHVVDILRAFGDKRSKNLIREGESKFKGEEGLVQAIGEYVAGRMRNKSMASKVKNWLQKFWSNMKTKLGMHNAEDVARILGEKVLKGKIPKGKGKEIRTKYQVEDKNLIHRRIMAKEKDSKIISNVPKNDLKAEQKLIFGNPIGKGYLAKATAEQMKAYEKFLENHPANGGASKSSIPLSISDVNNMYSVLPGVSKEILKLMGVKDGMYEYASKETAREYASYVRQQYDKPLLERSSFEQTQELVKKKFSWKQYLSRGLMPVWLVLKNYGGEPGKKIAKSLLDHEWVEHVKYRGPGDQAIYRIRKRLGKKIKYIHLFDKERAKRNYNEGNLTPEEKSFYENVYVKKNAKSDEYKAHQSWNALSEFYWKSLESELSRHQTPEGVRSIMKELDRKKVDDYMTRRLTKKGLEYIEKDKNFIADLVNENIKGGAAKSEAKKRLIGKSEEEIKILEERLKDISTKEGQDFYEDVRTELYDSMVYGYATVKNPHLIERNSLLREYVDVTNDKGRLEKIKIYDDSMSATAETYVTRMSKYLASVRLFPEWTGVGNKYKIDTSKRKIMEQMETKADMAAYAIKSIKRQLGIDKTEMQALNMPTYRLLGSLTNTSAALGLSSPMSGIKNLLIGIPRSIGDYGFLNTMSGIKKGFSSLAYHEARRRGTLEYGAKTLELGTIGVGSKLNLRNMFKYINWMTPTENFNRIVSSHAGHLYFAQAQSVLRGEGSMFKMGTNKKRMKRLMEELWHLDAEEISFMENTKDFSSQDAMTKHAEILHKVGHFSHVSAQGGTSTVLLPLWMSSKEAKPLTLFQRIATSTTIDSYRNFIKPAIEFGNIMPLARAALAHSVSGAVLYAMYDELFGKVKPVGSKEMQGDWFSNVQMNLWRSEFFGMFGEILSPHDKALAVPLATPIVLRNLNQAGVEFRQYWLGGKSLSQASQDYAKKTAVIYGQFADAFPKVHSSKFYKDFMQVRSMKHKYLEEKGEPRYSNEGTISRRTPYYRNLKYAMMFGTDEDIGKEYWKAFSAIVEMELRHDAYTHPWKIAKSVRKSIKDVIRQYDPYNISDDMKGTTKSKQDQFLDWLTPENKAMAKSVKAQYQVRLRKYYKIIADPQWRNKWSAFPNL